MHLYAFSISETSPNGPAFLSSACVLADSHDEAHYRAEDFAAIEYVGRVHPEELRISEVDKLWAAADVPFDFVQRLNDHEQCEVMNAKLIQLLTRPETEKAIQQIALNAAKRKMEHELKALKDAVAEVARWVELFLKHHAKEKV